MTLPTITTATQKMLIREKKTIKGWAVNKKLTNCRILLIAIENLKFEL